MQLTLEQTATRLGKSKRQVLYMIQKGRLQAQKIAGRWWIESHHLPRSDAQQRSFDRKRRQLRAAVEEALEIEPEAARSRRYSVRDLKAFQIALPLYQQTLTSFGTDHPATRCLKGVLEQLTRGCHRFDRSDKSEAEERRLNCIRNAGMSSQTPIRAFFWDIASVVPVLRQAVSCAALCHGVCVGQRVKGMIAGAEFGVV
jgi:hypothetical protein